MASLGTTCPHVIPQRSEGGGKPASQEDSNKAQKPLQQGLSLLEEAEKTYRDRKTSTSIKNAIQRFGAFKALYRTAVQTSMVRDVVTSPLSLHQQTTKESTQNRKSPPKKWHSKSGLKIGNVKNGVMYNLCSLLKHEKMMEENINDTRIPRIATIISKEAQSSKRDEEVTRSSLAHSRFDGPDHDSFIVEAKQSAETAEATHQELSRSSSTTTTTEASTNNSSAAAVSNLTLTSTFDSSRGNSLRSILRSCSSPNIACANRVLFNDEALTSFVEIERWIPDTWPWLAREQQERYDRQNAKTGDGVDDKDENSDDDAGPSDGLFIPPRKTIKRASRISSPKDTDRYADKWVTRSSPLSVVSSLERGIGLQKIPEDEDNDSLSFIKPAPPTFDLCFRPKLVSSRLHPNFGGISEFDGEPQSLKVPVTRNTINTPVTLCETMFCLQPARLGNSWSPKEPKVSNASPATDIQHDDHENAHTGSDYEDFSCPTFFSSPKQDVEDHVKYDRPESRLGFRADDTDFEDFDIESPILLNKELTCGESDDETTLENDTEEECYDSDASSSSFNSEAMDGLEIVFEED